MVDTSAAAQPGPGGDVLDALGHIEQVLPGEFAVWIVRRVAAGFDAESPPRQRRILAEHLRNLGVAPDVERPLHLVRGRVAGLIGRDAVGIFRRVEPAGRVGHVAQHVRQRVLGDIREEAVAARLPRLEVREHELALVVQHLLEVRDAPFRIHGIPVEPAADVIAHAPERHGAERFRHHQQRRLRAAAAGRPPRMLAQQEQQLRWTRKLRRLAEASLTPIERHLELLDALVERVGSASCDSARDPAPAVGDELQPVEQLGGSLD